MEKILDNVNTWVCEHSRFPFSLFSIYQTFLNICGIILNCSVIMFFVCYKSFKSPRNVLILFLCVSHTLHCIIPFLSFALYSPHGLASPLLCDIFWLAHVTLVGISSYTIVAISVLNLILFYRPFRFRFWITYKNVEFVVIGIVLSVFLIDLLTILLPSHFKYKQADDRSNNLHCNLITQKFYTIVFASAFVVIPSLVLLGILPFIFKQQRAFFRKKTNSVSPSYSRGTLPSPVFVLADRKKRLEAKLCSLITVYSGIGILVFKLVSCISFFLQFKRLLTSFCWVKLLEIYAHTPDIIDPIVFGFLNPFVFNKGILGSGFALKVQQQQRQKHQIRRKTPASRLIQCLWRWYASDVKSKSKATWKIYMHNLEVNSISKENTFKHNASFVRKFSTRRNRTLNNNNITTGSLSSHNKKVTSSKNLLELSKTFSNIELSFNSFNKSPDDEANFDSKITCLTSVHKNAIRFIRRMQFLVARRKFKEALKPYDVKDVIEQYSSGHIDLLSRVKNIQFRFDSILGKLGTKNKDVYISNCSLASRIVNTERQVQDIDNKLNQVLELLQELSFTKKLTSHPSSLQQEDDENNHLRKMVASNNCYKPTNHLAPESLPIFLPINKSILKSNYPRGHIASINDTTTYQQEKLVNQPMNEEKSLPSHLIGQNVRTPSIFHIGSQSDNNEERNEFSKIHYNSIPDHAFIDTDDDEHSDHDPRADEDLSMCKIQKNHLDEENDDDEDDNDSYFSNKKSTPC